MAKTFIIWAGDTSALTAAPSTVASAATAIPKTLLQVKGLVDLKIVEWGYTLDTVPAANVRMELVETGTIFATVTSIGSGIIPFDDPNAAAASASFTASTTGTGFNASAEGTIVANKLYDYQYENGLYFKKQFPLGREPGLKAGNALRIRATPTTASAINIMPYVIVEA